MQSFALRFRNAWNPILELLREHPAGLSAEEIRVYLRPDKPLGDVCRACGGRTSL